MKYILKDGTEVESIPLGRCSFKIGDVSVDGMLTICDRGPNIARPSCSCSAVICRCICGNYTLITYSSFKSGATKSCGCFGKQQRAELCRIVGRSTEPRVDYKGVENPFYSFLERTEEKDSAGYKWLIQCKKCGETYLETPNQLVSEKRPKGNNPCGCWKKQSQGCNKIEELLIANNIPYSKEKTFEDCISPKGNLLRFDFFVNESYIIEYDGEQHFLPVAFNSKQDGTSKLMLQKQYDEIKDQYCLKNNLPLIRIPYTHYKDISLEDLLPNSQFLIQKK